MVTTERIGELVMGALYGRPDSSALQRALSERLGVLVLLNYETDTISGVTLEIRVPR